MRSGYELVRTIGSIGVVDGAVGRAAVVALAVLPLLAAGALLAASLRHPRVVATLAAMAGIVSGTAGAVVLRAPVAAEAGASVAVAAGVLTVGAAAVAWRVGR